QARSADGVLSDMIPPRELRGARNAALDDQHEPVPSAGVRVLAGSLPGRSRELTRYVTVTLFRV
ncbi:hypothetical protein ACFWF3_29395, partial [Nocardia sp. NPDC060220]|uniref:hypothetical protein n=1 Tax=Nocardia sp. NPDC060220 TaxID=3347076 RepID=UPI003652C6A6